METQNQQSFTPQPLSLGSWVLTVFLIHLPLVGLIAAIVWALDSNGDAGRQRYAQATLIIYGALVVLFTSLFIGGFSIFQSLLDGTARF